MSSKRVSDEKSSSIFQMTAARTSTTEESNSDNENTRLYCNKIDDDDGTQSLLESSTSMSQSAPSRPPAARWKRWLSIFVLYVAMVDSSSTYSIVMSSLFPYLLQLTGGKAHTILLGGVVAGYCFSQLVIAPIMGFWSDRRPTKEPLIVGLSVSAVANIAYCYASALPSGGEYVVLVARMVMGGCAGISAVARSYVAYSTSEDDRSLGLAGVSGSQTLGLFIGPLLALIFVPLGNEGIHIPAIRFHFNMYTGPVYFSALLDIMCALLVLLTFREYKINTNRTKEDVKEEEKNETKGIDWVAVLVTLVIVFIMYSTVPIIESVMVPYSMDEFAWSSEQATLYNSIIFTCLALLAIVTYFVVGFIVKWVELRVMMMIGLFVLGVSFLVFIPMSNHHPKIMSIDQDNSTVAVGCRSRQLMWCREIPQLLLSQYIIGLLIMAAGYATSILPTFTLYSRLLGPHPQGFMMGILSSVNSFAQAAAPLIVTFMYEHVGPQITFGSVVGILSLAILLLLVFCYRMVPYGQKRHL